VRSFKARIASEASSNQVFFGADIFSGNVNLKVQKIISISFVFDFQKINPTWKNWAF
jgi:hypothetical protein